jgi:hypothetical protein
MRFQPPPIRFQIESKLPSDDGSRILHQISCNATSAYKSSGDKSNKSLIGSNRVFRFGSLGCTDIKYYCYDVDTKMSL